MKWKRGMALSTVMVILLLLAFLVIGMQFASRLNAATKEYADITQCRNSLIANAYARVHASDERLAINCKQRDDLVISYSDIRHGRTVQGKKVAIMDILADELATTHYRFIGDVHNATPLANNPGMYCLIDRRISFDDRIKQDEDLRYTDHFLTYLINAQKSRDVYYSEYLYGYRKQVREEERFSDVVASVKNQARDPDLIARAEQLHIPDIIIDTSLEYYSTHIIVRDLSMLNRLSQQGVLSDQNILLESGAVAAGCVGATGLTAAGLKMMLWGGGASVTGVGAIIGAPVASLGGVVATTGFITLLGCGGYTYESYNTIANAEQDTLKMTLLVPVESFRDLRCTEVYR